MNRDSRVTDNERRLSNMTLIGVVSKVDHEKARYRVKSGDTETDWIPLLQRRAGGTTTYESMDEGEQVMVLAPSGDLAQGVILGSLFTNETQPADKGNIHRTKYPDGTIIDYDHDAKSYSVAVADGGSFALNIGGGASVTGSGNALKLTAGAIEFESSTLTHNGVNIGDTHKHGGVVPGAALTDVPE